MLPTARSGSPIRLTASTASILGSPHNPKFLWVDDAEIVGDRITEVRPVPGNFFTQETERRISELGACCVAFVGIGASGARREGRLYPSMSLVWEEAPLAKHHDRGRMLESWIETT